MPTGRFKYEKLAKYPHMKPEDVLTWEAFLTKYPTEYQSVDYDVAVGDVPELAAAAEAGGIAGAEKVNQYKIDVVGYKKNSIDLIEVKSKALPSAIGQLSMYKNRYDKEIKPSVQTFPVILARTAAPHMEELSKDEGVLIILV